MCTQNQCHMRKRENILKKKYKVRVAIVCGSMNIGGGEMMAAKLAGYIDRDKFDVKYFVIAKYIDNQIAENLRNNKTEFECLGLPNSFNFRSYKKFAQALKNYLPDVVHCHLDVSYSWIWSILNNKPLISTMHSNPFIRRDKRVAAVMKIKSIQGKLRVIGCSKKTMELVQRCYHLKDSQMGYIYNPISVSDFMQAPFNNTKCNFVALGRLHKIKNYPLMLQAFKIVSETHENIHLSIAGSGSLEIELKKLVEQLGIKEKVDFLGNVRDVPSLLNRMDVLLLSSTSEACPMVILEAMASGLPVIATDVGGVSELISDNGIVVPSEDVNTFALAMIKIIDDPFLLKDMGYKGRLYSSKYDKTNIAAEYGQEYLNLV